MPETHRFVFYKNVLFNNSDQVSRFDLPRAVRNAYHSAIAAVVDGKHKREIVVSIKCTYVHDKYMSAQFLNKYLSF